MPIEIREVAIKLVIEDQVEGNKATTGLSSSGANNTSQQQMLVELCVRQVLQILEEKRSR